MSLDLMKAGAVARRAALARLDVEDCDCPIDLSCPCNESCPPGPSPACIDCVAGPVPPWLWPDRWYTDSRTMARKKEPRDWLRHPAEGCCREHCPHCRQECNCLPASFQPPCRHVLQAHDHGLSMRELAELFSVLDEYHEPPPPAGPAMVLDLQGRLAFMDARERAGVGLYHRLDLWRREEAIEAAGLGVLAPHTRSGRCEKEEYVASERRAA